MARKLTNCGKRGDGQELLLFHCPGCGYGHAFEVPRWTWNGSMDSPTFSPSLLIEAGTPGNRCHLFVKEGCIEFLSDCHHKLAGQTVEMIDREEIYGEGSD